MSGAGSRHRKYMQNQIFLTQGWQTSTNALLLKKKSCRTGLTTHRAAWEQEAGRWQPWLLGGPRIPFSWRTWYIWDSSSGQPGILGLTIGKIGSLLFLLPSHPVIVLLPHGFNQKAGDYFAYGHTHHGTLSSYSWFYSIFMEPVVPQNVCWEPTINLRIFCPVDFQKLAEGLGRCQTPRVQLFCAWHVGRKKKKKKEESLVAKGLKLSHFLSQGFSDLLHLTHSLRIIIFFTFKLLWDLYVWMYAT